eukprot:Gregarina_sp_Poly_1__10220@NODE_709_length_6670_cov_39_483265_g536_i0_p2_GENE_NODE_709_length_6670_cov_39_483265_g536_i0NODE_709_length_6670_cov_39_483265_g536_i0_p2_ORF_typecomplete_len422_score47_41Shugoshin_N/PF07558_11/0_31_NODE_709_length_6670_cov_39_483265_g536_i053776642
MYLNPELNVRLPVSWGNNILSSGGWGPFAQQSLLTPAAPQALVAPRYNLVPKVPVYIGNTAELVPVKPNDRNAAPQRTSQSPVLHTQEPAHPKRPQPGWLEDIIQKALPPRLKHFIPPRRGTVPASLPPIRPASSIAPIDTEDAEAHMKAADKVLDALAEDTLRTQSPLCIPQSFGENRRAHKHKRSNTVDKSNETRLHNSKPKEVPSLNLSAIHAGSAGRQDVIRSPREKSSSPSQMKPLIVHESGMKQWQVPVAACQQPQEKPDGSRERAHPGVQTVSGEESRLAILPGGMYARVNEIYIEEGTGSSIGRNLYAIPLKNILKRLDILEREYHRLRRENISLKERVWTFYSRKKDGQVDCLQLPPNPELLERATLQSQHPRENSSANVAQHLGAEKSRRCSGGAETKNSKVHRSLTSCGP